MYESGNFDTPKNSQIAKDSPINFDKNQVDSSSQNTPALVLVHQSSSESQNMNTVTIQPKLLDT